MAAGLSLRLENLPAFRERMRLRVARILSAELLGPKIDLDEDVPLSAITAAVVREVGRLAPHGAGNPEPVLAASRVRVAGEPRLMGKRSDHLSFYLTQEGISIRAVGFGMGDLQEPLRKAQTVSVAFTPRINAWKGKESVELHLKDVRIDT